MRLLIDTDVFCKLGAAGLLQEAASALGVPWSECYRLAALPHMLKRGRLSKQLGPGLCADLLPVAQELPVLPDEPSALLEALTGVPNVDPGEAQLFAAACANPGDFLLSGDKRALRAAKEIPGLVERLNRRVVTLEALFLVLCARLGEDQVRSMVGPALALDLSLRCAFGALRPVEGLTSYFSAQAKEVAPLVLWSP